MMSEIAFEILHGDFYTYKVFVDNIIKHRRP